jgi:hypothetical protein
MSTTPFEYLLNAMEHAAAETHPAKHGYAEKRRAVLDYVATVAEIAEARKAEMLDLANKRNIVDSSTRVARAEERLGRIMAEHHARVSESR